MMQRNAESASEPPLLQVQDLRLRFAGMGSESLTLCGADFTVHSGETLALIGESGCGKTLTALSILRLQPPAARFTAGRVLLHGQDLLQLPEYAMRSIRGRRIAMIFQEPQTSLNPVMSVGKQIAEALSRHRGLRAGALQEGVIELLDAVGIPQPRQRATMYPHQLSGGMKQRVMISIALAGEPELLVADEPTTALDVTIQEQILSLLEELQRRIGMAILFITHDLGVAARIADRIAVMRHGSIVETARCSSFFRDRRHPYSQSLFDALPSRLPKPARKPAGGEVLLEVKDFKLHFPVRGGLLRRVVGQVPAVDGVSLQLRAGHTLALVGESGSGKTTLGKGILQLLRGSQGSVRFRERELTQLRREELRRQRSQFQIVFQDPYASMNPRMRIADVIEEGMLSCGIGGDQQQRSQRIDQLLGQVGMEPECKRRYPHEFSGGQRQRICIARALAVQPAFLVCDEPTSSLDVSVQSQILKLLLELQQSLGLAYLFITHNIGVVEYLADEVAVMYRGKLVEHGLCAQVLQSPQHEYTRQLLAAVPKIPQ